MDIVSKETAKRLEAAGFPQPIPIFGQVWYNSRGNKIVIGGGRFGFGVEYYAMAYGGQNLTVRKSELVFAPTAADILRELPNDSLLIAHHNAGPNGETVFKCQIEPHVWKTNQSPSEACASAWLSIHEKTATI
jgi:hypothetical protein